MRTQTKPRRTQAERRSATRTALLETARRLFAQRGYAETSTPNVAREAGVTRGALYHHFVDKLDLFRAVVTEEDRAVADAIDEASTTADPVAALIAGGGAYLQALADPGRRRILAVDAPVVLGRAALRTISAQHSARTLVEGIEAAIAAGAIQPLPALPLSDMFEALFDRAAEFENPSAYLPIITALVEGLRLLPPRP